MQFLLSFVRTSPLYLVFWLFIGLMKYRSTERFRRITGKSPWGIHPLVWGLSSVFISLFVTLLAFIAMSTGQKRRMQQGQGSVPGGGGAPGPSGGYPGGGMGGYPGRYPGRYPGQQLPLPQPTQHPSTSPSHSPSSTHPSPPLRPPLRPCRLLPVGRATRREGSTFATGTATSGPSSSPRTGSPATTPSDGAETGGRGPGSVQFS